MDRIAIFVDAGYLFAAGGEALTGNLVKRADLKLDHGAVLTKLEEAAKKAAPSVSLLRIYWYDGTSGRPSANQVAIAGCDNVKMRLGLLNASGQQKGVDSLIVTDMIELARNHAIVDALLVSGDEDVRVGVQQAQAWGVRVYLLGIDSGRHNQAPTLQQEADAVLTWDKNDMAGFLQHIVPPTAPSQPTAVLIAPAPQAVVAPLAAGPPSPAEIGEIAAKLAATVPAADLNVVNNALRSSTPPEWDRLLIKNAIAVLGRDPIEQETKRALRKEFKLAVRKRAEGR